MYIYKYIYIHTSKIRLYVCIHYQLIIRDDAGKIKKFFKREYVICDVRINMNDMNKFETSLPYLIMLMLNLINGLYSYLYYKT